MRFRGKKQRGWKRRRNCLLHTWIHKYIIVPSVTLVHKFINRISHHIFYLYQAHTANCTFSMLHIRVDPSVRSGSPDDQKRKAKQFKPSETPIWVLQLCDVCACVCACVSDWGLPDPNVELWGLNLGKTAATLQQTWVKSAFGSVNPNTWDVHQAEPRRCSHHRTRPICPATSVPTSVHRPANIPSGHAEGR